ncbi:MAG: hypothetical protein LBI10_09065, partial [Deltaproteobacteria bacterium]|nr:hypothetical protein [Deltaproteobacteria bacterium]
DNFSEFCDKIDSIINNIDNKYAKEINSLISEQFQFFDNLVGIESKNRSFRTEFLIELDFILEG